MVEFESKVHNINDHFICEIPTCKARFAWKNGYIVHVNFHKKNVIDDYGHLTEEMKLRALRGRGKEPKWYADWKTTQNMLGPGATMSVHLPHSHATPNRIYIKQEVAHLPEVKWLFSVLETALSELTRRKK